HAAPLVLVVLPALPQLAANLVEDNRDRGEPGVRVGDLRAGRAVPPGHQDVADALVLLEVADALAIHPEHLLPLPVTEGRRGIVVAGALHDQLGGAPWRDPVVESHALAHQLLLDAE